MPSNRFNLVFRDYDQALYANRIPLNHPTVLKIFGIWNELVKSNKKLFGAIEAGGADPQVRVVYDNKDYAEAYRRIRVIAPDSMIRPLWRGNNGFLLAPSHPDDLQHLLKHLADDLADPDSSSQEKELLRIKVFDSQANINAVTPTIKIIKDLQIKGYRITPEIAIPYSDDKAYSDELYIRKFLEAAKLLEKEGFNLNECHISIKDMGGEMSAQAINRLLPKIIAALEEAGFVGEKRISLGVHLHDTGLAVDANVAAIKICSEKDYPLSVDSVECDLFDRQFRGDNAWKNAGFASMLQIDQKLKESGHPGLGLTETETSQLKEIARLVKEVSIEYAVKRGILSLSDEDVRKYHIPGGGLTSFIQAVSDMGKKQEGLAVMLSLSDEQAIKIAGHALIAVAKLMGHPFAVTPGFLNKQIAAMNLLQNMIDAKILLPGMSVEDIVKILEIPLTDEQVKTLFINNLRPAVLNFLREEMPAPVHPVIVEYLGTTKHEQPQSKVAQARAITEKLLEDGRIKPTPTQADAVLKKFGLTEEDSKQLLKMLEEKEITYASPDGSNESWQPFAREMIEIFLQGKVKNPENIANEIVYALERKALQTNTTWALMLGLPDKVEAKSKYETEAIERFWWHEAGPKDNANPADYSYAMDKSSRKRKNPVLDEAEVFFSALKRGELPPKLVHEYRLALQNLERAEIRLSVLDFLRNNSGKSLNDLIVALNADQKRIYREKTHIGEEFILLEARRLDIAFACLASILKVDKFAIDAKFKEMEEVKVNANGVKGSISELRIKSDEVVEVKKDQPLLMISTGKLERVIPAPKSGKIKLQVKKDDNISGNEILATYQDDISSVDEKFIPKLSTIFDEERIQEPSQNIKLILKMIR